MPIICGSTEKARTRLRKARIQSPVFVDTAGDCRAQLDANLAGITDASAGQERLYSPQARLVSSELNLYKTIAAFNRSHSSGPFRRQRWMDMPTKPAPGYVNGDSGELNVPIPANIVRSSLEFTQTTGDVSIRGFWYLCPGCVTSASDYELEGWVNDHPESQVVAATCDNTRQEAADFAVEHGWTFPVYVYAGRDNFATCFDQLMKQSLGVTWYGDNVFLRNGKPSAAADGSFPGLPVDY
jgi:hypothetical protein